MQRLLDFIEQNLYIILFAVLQLVSAFLIFGMNHYQQAAFSNSLATVTSELNQMSSNVTSFIGLKDQNALLQEQVSDQFRTSSLGQVLYLRDTFQVKDSVGRILFDMTSAQVVYNTSYKANNVFVINKGLEDGVRKNMGVISSQGLAGIVLNSNRKYSTVMSLLNTNMTVIPNINGQEYYTKLIWDNIYPNSMAIKGINKLEKIEVGDLIQTGKSSLLFPEGIPIGRVTSLEEIPNSQYFKIRIETSTNFRKLDYVYVIENKDANLIEPLLEE